MTKRILILGVALAMGLTGCTRVADSRLNPFNWFGEAETETTTVAEVERDIDPRPRVAQVTSLRIEPTPTGAIIRATGLPPTQGWFAAALVPESEKPVNGEIVYVFRAVPPAEQQRVSTPQSRELNVASSLSSQELAATRLVRVVGAQNSLVARR